MDILPVQLLYRYPLMLLLLHFQPFFIWLSSTASMDSRISKPHPCDYMGSHALMLNIWPGLVSQDQPHRFLRSALLTEWENNTQPSEIEMPWSTVASQPREGTLGLFKGASSKEAVHVILISDRRGLGHLCSTGEQNGRLPFRCQELPSIGKIQRAQKAEELLFPWTSLENQRHRKPIWKLTT